MSEDMDEIMDRLQDVEDMVNSVDDSPCSVNGMVLENAFIGIDQLWESVETLERRFSKIEARIDELE